MDRISIHLMFLLIPSGRSQSCGISIISIHLMFLLIGRAGSDKRRPDFISIHLMFLLILVSGGGKDGDEKHFNTSHVSINL